MANSFSIGKDGEFVDVKPEAPVAAAAPSSAAPSAAPQSAAAPAPAIPSPGDSSPPEPVANDEVDGSAGDPTPAAPAGDTAAPAAADDSVGDPDAPGAEKRTVPYGRFSSVVAERNILRESYQHQARMIEQLTAQRAAPAAPAAAPAAQAPAADDPPPTLEAHGFDAAKLALAQAEWLRRQVKSGVTAEMQAAQAQQATQAVEQAFATRTTAFKAATPDFDAVVMNPALPTLSRSSVSLIKASESGPQIIYHLAKRPDEAVRIARMSPEHQAMALGRIEAGLSAPATTAKNPATSTTRAPNPLTPTTGRGNSPSVDPAKLSTKDWIAQDRKQDEARRASRRGR